MYLQQALDWFEEFTLCGGHHGRTLHVVHWHLLLLYLLQMAPDISLGCNWLQRRGRAGRVQPGESYHLYPKCVYEAFSEYQLPELLRTPLNSLCLQIKSLQVGSIGNFLSSALQPPESLAVSNIGHLNLPCSFTNIFLLSIINKFLEYNDLFLLCNGIHSLSFKWDIVVHVQELPESQFQCQESLSLYLSPCAKSSVSWNLWLKPIPIFLMFWLLFGPYHQTFGPWISPYLSYLLLIGMLCSLYLFHILSHWWN